MELIRGLHCIRPHHKRNVVTIGNFDGVHHGHRMLLAHLNAKRDELGCPSLIMTFEPQPREFFRGVTVPARLTRFREKMTLFRELGVDRVLCIPFNETTAQMAPGFVVKDILKDLLDTNYIVVGDDFRFGRDQEGDYTMLEEAGDKYGYVVGQIGTLSFEHERISSSRIRHLLAEDDLLIATMLLGRAYSITGRVVYGRQLGRVIGVPTANIRLQRYRSAIQGVFAVSVEGLEQNYFGVANVGVRPTVDGEEPLLEVHIFDFDKDIYGELLTVKIHKKLREEIKFESLEALKTQINEDIKMAKKWFYN